MTEHNTYDGGFQRHNEPEKPRYTHIPLNGLERVAARGTLGAEKYGNNLNWALADITDPEQLARFNDAIFRHLMQFLQGDVDEDHLAALAWNALALLALQNESNREKVI